MDIYGRKSISIYATYILSLKEYVYSINNVGSGVFIDTLNPSALAKLIMPFMPSLVHWVLTKNI